MRILFLTCALLMSLSVKTVQSADLHIDDAWIREAPPGVEQLAGYVIIENAGHEARILQKVSSPAFERIELHRTRIEGDVAKMERKESLTLKPGQRIVFKPGDYHLMLFDPVQPLHAGDRVELTFSFQSQPPVTVSARVRRPDAGGSEASHHHH